VSYKVEITRNAEKVLSKLDKLDRHRVEGAIERLAEDPRPQGIVMLKGRHGQLRYKVGDFRIIYEVFDHKLVVLIVEIGNRREVYR